MHVVHKGEVKKAHKILIRRPEGNYNFAFCFVWLWNLFIDIAWGKEAEGVWEHGVEENIWTQEGRGNGEIEEIA